jgi:hypothetical protein
MGVVLELLELCLALIEGLVFAEPDRHHFGSLAGLVEDHLDLPFGDPNGALAARESALFVGLELAARTLRERVLARQTEAHAQQFGSLGARLGQELLEGCSSVGRKHDLARIEGRVRSVVVRRPLERTVRGEADARGSAGVGVSCGAGTR